MKRLSRRRAAGAIIIVMSSLTLGHAFAQEDNLEPSAEERKEIITSCVAASSERAGKQECIGKVSTVCQEKSAGGSSTSGMAACSYAETDVWDALLNAQYKVTMATFRNVEMDNTDEPNERAAATLRDAQRSWIKFRDTQCTAEAALWGSGSGRQVAHATCLMRMTAERFLSLEELNDL